MNKTIARRFCPDEEGGEGEETAKLKRGEKRKTILLPGPGTGRQGKEVKSLFCRSFFFVSKQTDCYPMFWLLGGKFWLSGLGKKKKGTEGAENCNRNCQVRVREPESVHMLVFKLPDQAGPNCTSSSHRLLITIPSSFFLFLHPLPPFPSKVYFPRINNPCLFPDVCVKCKRMAMKRPFCVCVFTY